MITPDPQKTLSSSYASFSSSTLNEWKQGCLSKISANQRQVASVISLALSTQEENASSMCLSSGRASPLSGSVSPLPGNISPLSVVDMKKIRTKKFLSALSRPTFIPSFIREGEEESDPLKLRASLIHWLKDNDFLFLAEKFQSETGLFWDRLASVRDPIFMEQLADIYLLAVHKKIPPVEIEQVIDFSFSLAHVALSFSEEEVFTQQHQCMDDAKHLLGEILYLIDLEPASVVQIMQSFSNQMIVEQINKAFSVQVTQICETLHDHYEAHNQSDLQSPEAALHTRIPCKIAQALLTSTGRINFGIITILSNVFLPHEEHPINHEANLSHALDLLEHSPKLRSEFDKISAPAENKIALHTVIRTSLSLPAGHVVSDVDTRLTLLIAILSHLRQGEDRSCFAVSLAIEILSAHLGFCLKDLQEILRDGRMVRTRKSGEKSSSFIMRISDENLHKKTRFTREGRFIIGEKKLGGFLWEAPGLLAVCRSIGIIDPQKALLKIVQDGFLSAEREPFYEMDVKKIIEYLCLQAYGKEGDLLPRDSFEALVGQGCFAFSAQTTQPLLKIWENAIANMSEVEDGGTIKKAIMSAVMDAFQFRLAKLNIPPSRLLQRFFLSIQKELFATIQPQYDPVARAKYAMGNVEGGFVLYQENQRIDTEESFRLLLKSIVDDVCQKMEQTPLSEEERKSLYQVKKIMGEWMGSVDFMPYLLARYHPANREALGRITKGSLISLSRLKFTPWLTQSGNNSKELLKVYLESDEPIQTEQFVVSTAENALARMINLCKKMSAEEKIMYQKNPHKLKQLCILGKHTLPFMVGTPSFVDAWHRDLPAEAWIEQSIHLPGMEVASALTDPITKKNFEIWMQKNLSEEFLQKDLLQAIKKIPLNGTIRSYRDAVISIFHSMNPSLKEVPKLLREVDTGLAQSLAPPLKKKLEDSAVHFADTNWSTLGQDIHFCFVINPGTSKLELWEVCADGSKLTAIDQDYWLTGQQWEFMMMEQKKIPDDSTLVQ